MKLSVVIPAHNEVDSIAETVERTALELERNEIDYEIVVVDDASGDGTGDRVRRAVEAVAERALSAITACLRGSDTPCVPVWPSTPATPLRS